MKLQQELLATWSSRYQLSDAEKFSSPAKERIADLLLDSACCVGYQDNKGGAATDLDEASTELAKLGIEDRLSVPSFYAELRNCQLSLFGLLVSQAVEASAQKSSADHGRTLHSMASQMASLDGLIAQSCDKLIERNGASEASTASPDSDDKKGKTLQHEIRTPLQGALLTTELMLEDAAQGDPVSADDILAVRKSIETAVGILNDFASRSKPE